MVHIHQAGTLRTYCERPVKITDVGWETAHRATCPDCQAAFEYSEDEA